MERVTLASLKELAATQEYDYKDHVYLSDNDTIKNRNWRVLLIDEKYIVVTLWYNVYINANGINKAVIKNNCHGGPTFKGKGEDICLPKNLRDEITSYDPNYILHGWDYDHELYRHPLGYVKTVPYKYMYYDIINIIENI